MSSLPPPVQSEYEPRLWSGFARFSCGHVLHCSFDGKPDTQEYTEVCSTCKYEQLPLEWRVKAAWCKEQRKAHYLPQKKGLRRASIEMAEQMLVEPGLIYEMEGARIDPAPLVKYWEGKQ